MKTIKLLKHTTYITDETIKYLDNIKLLCDNTKYVLRRKDFTSENKIETYMENFNKMYKNALNVQKNKNILENNVFYSNTDIQQSLYDVNRKIEDIHIELSKIKIVNEELYNKITEMIIENGYHETSNILCGMILEIKKNCFESINSLFNNYNFEISVNNEFSININNESERAIYNHLNAFYKDEKESQLMPLTHFATRKFEISNINKFQNNLIEENNKIIVLDNIKLGEMKDGNKLVSQYASSVPYRSDNNIIIDKKILYEEKKNNLDFIELNSMKIKEAHKGYRTAVNINNNLERLDEGSLEDISKVFEDNTYKLSEAGLSDEIIETIINSHILK